MKKVSDTILEEIRPTHEIYIDAFLSKLQSIARYSNLVIVTDLKQVKKDLLSVISGDDLTIKSKFPKREDLDLFKSLFKESVESFLKLMIKVCKGKCDTKKLMAIINSIEVKPRK